MATEHQSRRVDDTTRDRASHDHPGLFGSRRSRRRLLAQVIAGSLGFNQARSAALYQTPTAPVLNFSSWAIAEPSTRRNMLRALRLFEQIYGVHVNPVSIPFAGTLGQLEAWQGKPEMPDVMQLSGNWPHTLAHGGLLADLGPYRKDEPRLFEGSFGEVTSQAGMYNGVYYAVPFTMVPLGFWYSRSAMEFPACNLPDAPVMTISQLEHRLAELVREQTLPEDGYPIRIDVGVNDYAVTRFWPWIWNFGGDPMRDDAQRSMTIDWTDEGTTKAFQWLQGLADNKYLMPSATGWWDRQFFAYGKIGCMLDGPYLTSHIATHNARYSTRSLIDGSFGVTLPPVAADGMQPVTVADFHLLAISKSSKIPDLAWKLIQFLTTNELAINTFLIPQGGLLPVKSDNMNSEYGTSYSDDISQAFLTCIAPKMRLPPYDGPRYQEAVMLIAQAIQDVALRGAPVEQRLQQLDSAVKRVYEKSDCTTADHPAQGWAAATKGILCQH